MLILSWLSTTVAPTLGLLAKPVTVPVKIVVGLEYQLIPSTELTIFSDPIPPATQLLPAQHTAKQPPDRYVVPIPVQLVPLVEYAKVFVPSPPATNLIPFQEIE